MSIVILVGGNSAQGNPEHRYLVGQFLQHFGEQVTQIITVEPVKRPLLTRLKRLSKRGQYLERLRRAVYSGGYGPSAEAVQQLLLPEEQQPLMPGGDRVSVVNSHNSQACHDLLIAHKPRVIVVYGTAIIKESTSSLASDITLNMHTGLSPFYRGDSTLFWPVHENDPTKLGVTVHELVPHVDGGDIAATATIEYVPGDSEADLFSKAVKAGTPLYVNAVEQSLAGTLKLTAQDLSLGREFSWKDRSVAAERKVLQHLDQWARP